MYVFIQHYWALITAGILDVVYVPLTLSRIVGPEVHGLIGFSLVILSSLVIIRHYRGPRMKPGDRILSDEDVARLEDACFRAALIAVKQGRTEYPQLRAVSGN